MTLGEKIKLKMKEKHLNVKALSDMTGIAPTTLYSFFKRDSKTINISALIKIADALGVSIENLMEESAREFTPGKEPTAYYLTKKEVQLLEMYRKVDTVTQNTVKNILKYSYELSQLKNDNKKP